MGDYEIFDLSESQKWNEYLHRLPINQQDIYFTPEYYHLYEELGDGKTQCFVFEEDKKIALYPYLINSVNEVGYDLNEQYYDIQGAYGYNGISTNSYNQHFLNSFFDCFDEYCKQHNIIAEFLRINPLFQNPLIHRKNYELVHDRDNINANLLKENIFETEYEYSTRKNIRKAIKSGLTFKSVLGKEITNCDLESFCRIYNHTMKRNNAEDFYYFNTNYFNSISTQLKEKALFVFALSDTQIISCELVLLSGRIAYSFLGGTIRDYYQFRPNDFLKHETINLLKAMGYNNFLLGGGAEGVFNYKKSFSKNGVIPFYIGKKTHNKRVYDEVVSQWEIKYPEKVDKYKNFLLKYRY